VQIIIVLFFSGSRRNLRVEPVEELQARDEVGAQPEADRGVRRRAQGGLPPLEDQPEEGGQARRQEVVLHTNQGVWSLSINQEKVFRLSLKKFCLAILNSLVCKKKQLIITLQLKFKLYCISSSLH
jgi:hypothetical protein